MVSVSSILILLFYEITVVNFVLRRQPRTLEKHLSILTPDDLKSYVVVGDDGTQLLFRSLVDRDGKFETRKPTWKNCDTPDACYKMLHDESQSAEFFFTFEYGNRYALRKTPACGNLTVFETVTPIASVSAAWYYGPRFPKDKQVEIDKAILEQRLQHKVQDVINKENPPLNCGAQTEVDNIKPGVIGWLLLTISVLGVIPISLAAIGTIYYRR